MNRVAIAVLRSPCCSESIVLSADAGSAIAVCAACRHTVDLNNPMKTDWVTLLKEEQEHIRTVSPKDLEKVSMEMVNEDDDTTICGVLKMAYQGVEWNDNNRAKENIKKAIIYGRRMNTALEEYKATGIDRKEKPQREVDRETKERFSNLFNERSIDMITGRSKIGASELLKLTIENSFLRQELLKAEINNLQKKTLQAIDEEAKSLDSEIEGFDMDEMAFVIKESEVKE